MGKRLDYLDVDTNDSIVLNEDEELLFFGLSSFVTSEDSLQSSADDFLEFAY